MSRQANLFPSQSYITLAGWLYPWAKSKFTQRERAAGQEGSSVSTFQMAPDVHPADWQEWKGKKKKTRLRVWNMALWMFLFLFVHRQRTKWRKKVPLTLAWGWMNAHKSHVVSYQPCVWETYLVYTWIHSRRETFEINRYDFLGRLFAIWSWIRAAFLAPKRCNDDTGGTIVWNLQSIIWNSLLYKPVKPVILTQKTNVTQRYKSVVQLSHVSLA